MSFKKVIYLIAIVGLLSVVFTDLCCNSRKQGKITEFDEGYVAQLEGYTPFQLSFNYYGEKEVTGVGSNSIILDFLKSTASWVSDDETPWCSAFMNYTHAKAGYKFTGSLSARSWLDYGIKVEDPRPGDIVVLWRESRTSWKGHVGYFVRFNADKTKILVYGGNQYNSVVPVWYPTYRVLGYRCSVLDNSLDEGFVEFELE